MSAIRRCPVADSSATILSVTSTHDGEWAAACASSGHVYFYGSEKNDRHRRDHSDQTPLVSTTGSDAFVFNPSCLAAVEVPTTAIAFCPKPPVGLVSSSAPDTSYLALTVSSNGYVRQTLIDAARHGPTSAQRRHHKELTSSIESSNEVLAACYDTSGTVFVTGGSDTKLRLYDAESGENISVIQKTIGSRGQDTVGHNGRIFSIQFLDEMCFLSAGWESSMLLHDTRVRKAVRIFEGVHMSGDGIAILDGGRVVASASDRPKDQLQFFDIGTGSEVMPRITTPMNLFGCALTKGRGRPAILHAVGSQPAGMVTVSLDTTSQPPKAEIVSTAVNGFDGGLFGVATLSDGSVYVGGHKGGMYCVR